MFKNKKKFVMAAALAFSLSMFSIAYGYWTDHLELEGNAKVKMTLRVTDDTIYVEYTTDNAIQPTEIQAQPAEHSKQPSDQPIEVQGSSSTENGDGLINSDDAKSADSASSSDGTQSGDNAPSSDSTQSVDGIANPDSAQSSASSKPSEPSQSTDPSPSQSENSSVSSGIQE